MLYKNRSHSHTKPILSSSASSPKIQKQHQSARPTFAICYSLTSAITIQLAHSYHSKHFCTADMVAYTILSVLGLTLTALASPVPAAEPEALALLSGLTGTVAGVTGTVTSLVGSVPALRKS